MFFVEDVLEVEEEICKAAEQQRKKGRKKEQGDIDASWRTQWPRTGTPRRTGGCQHQGWWEKQTGGGAVCENCEVIVKHFTFRCPGCRTMACVPCRSQLTKRRVEIIYVPTICIRNKLRISPHIAVSVSELAYLIRLLAHSSRVLISAPTIRSTDLPNGSHYHFEQDDDSIEELTPIELARRRDARSICSGMLTRMLRRRLPKQFGVCTR